jgi:phosphatidylglycerol:prolipoprotein diacylglycerol transferase
MIFPRAIPLGEPRHPSQLYEAFFEGFVLLVLLNILFMKTNLREKPGFLCGVFIGGYGIFRFFIEYFREPDAFLGLLWLNLSMGQMLCIPMILVGLTLVIRAQRNA